MTQAPPEQTAGTAARCPRCQAPVEPDQLVCVECGERLGIRYGRPPSWRLPAAVVAGVALLAGAALAIALAEIDDDADRVARAPAQTQQLTTPAQPGATTTTETTPAGEETDATPEPPAPDEDEGSGQVESWPGGTSAYTVVLLSTGTRAGAEQVAEQAIAQGIEAGVLRSDDYSSLRPGFWVAYGGRFDSQDEAQSESQRYASQGFPGAYVRFVNGGE
jgi:septal ring-binding cell division protein DamX